MYYKFDNDFIERLLSIITSINSESNKDSFKFYDVKFHFITDFDKDVLSTIINVLPCCINSSLSMEYVFSSIWDYIDTYRCKYSIAFF